MPKYYTSVHTKPRVFRSHTQFTLSESLPQQQHRNGISRVGSSLPPVTYSDTENDNENVSDGSIRYCCSPACKIVLASILGVPSQTMVRSGCWMRGTSFGGGHGLAQIIMMKQDKVVTGGIISHPQVVMNADASLTGWGVHMGHLSLVGQWCAQEQLLHTNVLELIAVQLALQVTIQKTLVLI